MEINIRISSDVEGNFTTAEKAVLAALNASPSSATNSERVRVTEPVKAPEEEKAAEPTPAPAESPKRRRRTKAEIEAEKAAKAAAEAAEEEAEGEKTLQEELAEDDEGEIDYRQEAVTLATSYVSGGKSKIVRQALADVGCKKVAEIKDKDLPKFLEILKAESEEQE